MNRWNALLVASVGAAAFLLSAGKLQAQPNANPPSLMTYQGFLVDGNGNALATNAPKNYDVIFRIWDASSGGTKLWTEQQTVTVDKGYFSVLLGEGSNIGEPRPILNTLFTNATASDRWIGITVKGIGAGSPPADVDILPRLRLLSSPYAFLAHKAVTAATVDGAAVSSGTVADGRLSSNVALRAGGNTFSGNQIFSNNLGIGTNNPGSRIHVYDTANVLQRLESSSTVGSWLALGNSSTGGRYWHLISSGSANGGGGGKLLMTSGPTHNTTDATVMTLQSDGKIGIGTLTPGFPLNFGNVLGDKISLWGDSGNSYGFGIQNGLLQIHSDSSSSDIAFGYGSSASMTERMRIKGNGNVGIGTSSPSTTLDVAGSLKVSGGITTGSGGSTLPGHAPVIHEEQTANNQTTWNPKWIHIPTFADRPGGFKIRIYAQHETSFEVRNYEATIAVQKAGYANDPNFPNTYKRISINLGSHGRHSMILGYMEANGCHCNYAQEVYPDGWVKFTNHGVGSSTGTCSGGFCAGNDYLFITFHPHVSGQIVISDN